MINRRTSKEKNYTFLLILFIAYLSFLLIFQRNFTYISFNGLYISEVFLLLFFFISYFKITANKIRFRHLLNIKYIPICYFTYLIYGTIVFILSLFYLQVNIYTFRDYVIVYYAVFSLIIFNLIHNIERLSMLTKIIFYTSLISSILNLFNAFSTGFSLYRNEIFRFGGGSDAYIGGMGLIISINILLFKKYESNFIKNIHIVSVLINLLGIILSQHRSSWAGIIIAVLLNFILVYKNNINIRSLLKLIYIGLPLTLIAIIITFAIIKIPLNYYYQYIIYRMDLLNEVNSLDRIIIWKDIINSIFASVQNLVCGSGFGTTPVIDIVNGKVEVSGIHNSLLYIFYTMGLCGVILFFGIIISVIKPILSIIKNNVNSVNSLNAYAISYLCIFIYFNFFAFFNVVLEGPYMGIPYWIVLGILFSISKLDPKVTQ